MGSANFIPDIFVALLADLHDLPADRARKRWPALRRFLRFMEQSANYVSLCKVGCLLEGLDVGDVRAPFLMPTREERDAFTAELRRVREHFGPPPGGAFSADVTATESLPDR